MLVIGASQLSKYLAQIAVGLDYQVTICDPRDEYTETWDIPGVDAGADDARRHGAGNAPRRALRGRGADARSEARRPRADGGAEVAGVLCRRAGLARQQRQAPRTAAGVRRDGRRDRAPARSHRPLHRQPHAAGDRRLDPGRDHRGQERRCAARRRHRGRGQGELAPSDACPIRPESLVGRAGLHGKVAKNQRFEVACPFRFRGIPPTSIHAFAPPPRPPVAPSDAVVRAGRKLVRLAALAVARSVASCAAALQAPVAERLAHAQPAAAAAPTAAEAPAKPLFERRRRGTRRSRGAPIGSISSSRTTRCISTTTRTISNRICSMPSITSRRPGSAVSGSPAGAVPEFVRAVLAVHIRRPAMAADRGATSRSMSSSRPVRCTATAANTRTRCRSTSRRGAGDHSRRRLLRVKRYCGEFVLLGTNAALFTIGMTVP